MASTGNAQVDALVRALTDQKILWLCALFEQIGRTAGYEMTTYKATEVCKAVEPQLGEKLSNGFSALALLMLSFVGGWLARSCCGGPTARAPMVTPAPPRAHGTVVKRTMRTQSQTTYHYKWQSPRFAVVYPAQQGAWPEELYIGGGEPLSSFG